MNLYIPKQHGAWGMLVIPFVIGVIWSQPTWLHIPVFMGWILLYLTTYPLLMLIKGKQKELHIKWTLIYSMFAALFFIVPLFHLPNLAWFGIAMIPFFLINIAYSVKDNDRALFNDLSAIAAFSIGGVASYYVGGGSLDQTAGLVWFVSVLFFMGSTFFVKTLIRERKNPIFKWFSWSYHIGILILVAIIGLPVLIIAYLPSLIRAVWCYGKQMTPKQAGMLEMVNCIYFVLVLSIAF